jgi:hypothetical protein
VEQLRQHWIRGKPEEEVCSNAVIIYRLRLSMDRSCGF